MDVSSQINHLPNAMGVAGQMAHAPSSINPGMMDLFTGAHWIIQLIIVGLLVASVWSWTIIINKVYRLRRMNSAADQFEDAFWSGGALDDLYDRIHKNPKDPLSTIFCSAMREWRRTLSKGKMRTNEFRGTLEQRIDRVMQLTLGREMEQLERYMTFLASLGSNGMIVGLFGTVLGIMNSFEAISSQQSANLAVVAPGIAEALFATAIGLVAAIPAAIAFNKISSDLNRYANRLDAFSSEFIAIISRQLEENA
ncbi:MAG: protein TolQ [Candidatus Paracaedibacteraceae bacterium]|nr:protein TolQ [Candidatus Paracaedibacteraceae bacterium]